MWRSLKRNWATAPLIVVVACGGSERRQGIDARVYAWMQCQDCMHHQRNQVVALGDSAVPRLREILILGPPAAHDSAYVASLRRLAQRSPSLTPGLIEHQRQIFVALYRYRALSALTGIGGPAAKSALCLARATASPGAPIILAIDSSLAPATCP